MRDGYRRIGSLIFTLVTGAVAGCQTTTTAIDTPRPSSTTQPAMADAVPTAPQHPDNTSPIVSESHRHGPRGPDYEEGDFVLTHARLEDAFKLLGQQSQSGWGGAELRPEWDALERVGVTRDTRVSVRIWSPTVAKALNAILNSLGEEKREKLAFYTDDARRGTVVVTTARRHRWRDGYVVEYRIHDLMIDVPEGYDDEEPAGSGDRVLTRRERVRAVVQLIKDNVEPASWANAEACWISVDYDRLLIRQPADEQAQVANIFEQLRETRGYVSPLVGRVRPTPTPATQPAP